MEKDGQNGCKEDGEEAFGGPAIGEAVDVPMHGDAGGHVGVVDGKEGKGGDRESDHHEADDVIPNRVGFNRHCLASI